MSMFGRFPNLRCVHRMILPLHPYRNKHVWFIWHWQSGDSMIHWTMQWGWACTSTCWLMHAGGALARHLLEVFENFHYYCNYGWNNVCSTVWYFWIIVYIIVMLNGSLSEGPLDNAEFFIRHWNTTHVSTHLYNYLPAFWSFNDHWKLT